MKKVLFLLGIIFLLMFSGCSSDSNDEVVVDDSTNCVEKKVEEISGEVYHEINKVLIDSVECTLNEDYVIVEVENMIVNCSVSIGSTYVVEVFSNHGVYSRTMSVFE